VPYGAEEQDLEAGLQILESFDNITITDVKIDMNTLKVLFDRNLFNLNSKITFSDKLNYFINKFTTFDNTMTQAYTFENFLLVSKIIKESKFDIIISNTASTLLFGVQNYSKHIFRSISFEPIYVFRTVDSKIKATVLSILKFQALRKEFKADMILAISPRDAKYYKKIKFKYFTKKVEIMPLRQMINHDFKDYTSFTDNKMNIGFLGSTYNVLHNKKSLEFVLNAIPSECWERDTVQLNIYGRKIPGLLQSRETKNVIFHNWVEDINEIYSKNFCFIVPFMLASGMQSKVFEPLIRGRILICDPRVLSGYPFKPFQHYLPAESGKDFESAITWLLANPKEAITISKNAHNFAQQILGKQYIFNQTAKILETFS
jgi:hypothetical protein